VHHVQVFATGTYSVKYYIDRRWKWSFRIMLSVHATSTPSHRRCHFLGLWWQWAFGHKRYSCTYIKYAATDSWQGITLQLQGYRQDSIKCKIFCTMRLLQIPQNCTGFLQETWNLKQVTICTWSARNIYRRGNWESLIMEESIKYRFSVSIRNVN
jgi:hypothetical protein